MAGEILAVGHYTPVDEAALREAGAVMIDDFAELDGLGEAACAAVRAVAFKGHEAFSGAWMDRFEKLGLIANYGVGYDAIDVEAASARGIKVTNTPDVLNDDVADLAVAMWLMQGRNMVEGHARAQPGVWASEGELPLNRKMSGSVVGIVGLGRIGREIADRLAGFKCEIHYTSRREKDTPGWVYHADLVDMARAVDFLFVALVGGAETAGHVSRAVIEALGPRGVIINISRGTTIDEPALLDALENGTIAGAGLDVFLNEPNPDSRFGALKNVVMQPHQGSGTVETRAAMGQLQRDNIAAFLGNNPLLTPVN